MSITSGQETLTGDGNRDHKYGPYHTPVEGVVQQSHPLRLTHRHKDALSWKKFRCRSECNVIQRELVPNRWTNQVSKGMRPSLVTPFLHKSRCGLTVL